MSFVNDCLNEFKALSSVKSVKGKLSFCRLVGVNSGGWLVRLAVPRSQGNSYDCP
jgi:hypothetical protein